MISSGLRILMAMFLFSSPITASAGLVEDMIQEYAAQGAPPVSPSRAEAMWNSTHHPTGSDRPMSCATCHTADPKNPGRHIETGKDILPLSPSVNPERLTDRKTVEKWFMRNCKQVFGRECTPQEKGDFLTFIKNR